MTSVAEFVVTLAALQFADFASAQGCQPSWLPTVGQGPNSWVRGLTVFDDGGSGGPALYAGGFFSGVGGMPASHIAKWDGSNWSTVGGGVWGGINFDAVNALSGFDDGNGPALYAAGVFAKAGGSPANRIAKWDGTSWSPLGGGLGFFVDDLVLALTVFDDGGGSGPALYAGGRFLNAGTLTARQVAKWDGSSWSAVGGGLENNQWAYVSDLTVFDDGSGAGPALYAGGSFTTAGGVPANNLAKWSGTSWSPLGSGMNSSVFALSVFDDGTGGGPALHAGGSFTTAGSQSANRIARWDGSSWTALEGGMDDIVVVLEVFDDKSGGGPALYAGGNFWLSPPGSSYLAKWGCPPFTSFNTFCTAKTTLVCGPANIGATGLASATNTSGFVLTTQPVRGCRAGLLLYSNQPIVPVSAFGGPGNGMLCLSAMGMRRAGPIESGGTHPNFCDGNLSIDLNQFHTLNWAATGCSPPPGQNTPAGFLGNMGTTVNAQMWGRDSIATGQVLSNGIGWVVGP